MQWPKEHQSLERKIHKHSYKRLNRENELKVPEKGLACVHIYLSQECLVYLYFPLPFSDAFISGWKDSSPRCFHI